MIDTAHATFVDEVATYIRETFHHDVRDIQHVARHGIYAPDMRVVSLRDPTHQWWIEAKTTDNRYPDTFSIERRQWENSSVSGYDPLIYVWKHPTTGRWHDGTHGEVARQMKRPGPERALSEWVWSGSPNGRQHGEQPFYVFNASPIHEELFSYMDDHIALPDDAPAQLGLDGRETPLEALGRYGQTGDLQRFLLQQIALFGASAAQELGTVYHLHFPPERHGEAYADHRRSQIRTTGCCHSAVIVAHAGLKTLAERGSIYLDRAVAQPGAGGHRGLWRLRPERWEGIV